MCIIIISNFNISFCCLVMPWWAELQRHKAVVVFIVCVCQCVSRCNSIPPISRWALKLSAENCYASTKWSYSLATNLINLRVYSRVIALTPVSGQHGIDWRRGPVLAPWPSTCPDCNWYLCCVYIACLTTALVYTNKSLTALLILLLLSLLCLPAAANFYIVVSQDRM